MIIPNVLLATPPICRGLIRVPLLDDQYWSFRQLREGIGSAARPSRVNQSLRWRAGCATLPNMARLARYSAVAPV